ncbi:MAG: biotin--[acetyl-CoA-carboxylase] ligase [Armatimonadota bacterium]|jgi:BirA family biotin operon repressor/biotin-[acetyl-CoA-carboxylase] ligase
MSTRDRILQALRSADDHVSGGRLASDLGVSRSAVWKHIQRLRREGHAIAARPRRGYRLLGPRDVLTPEAIALHLRTSVIGRHIEHREITGSTMDDARQLALEGAEEGTVVVAELQTGGRGRRGREWLSPRSCGITASTILRPPIPPSMAQHISLLAALGVAAGVREATGALAAVKWPNDVVLDGRKLGGVLIELMAEADRIGAAIVGIGLNVNGRACDLAPRLAESATTLEDHLGHPADRVKVLCGVLNAIDGLYGDFCANGPEGLLARWRAADVCLGQWVTGVAGGAEIEGRAVGIRQDGALEIAPPHGLPKFLLAGDVSVRRNADGQ